MATDTFLKNPVLIVGTKQEVSAATIQENDLVAVTDERFYTAEEVDDIVSSTEQDIRSAISESEQSIRNDMNASDSELQTQITANAGEITTIKNDLGDLGDQVSTIESKIPNDTTDSNQLVNKQELTDTAADIRGDFDQADSELQSQITAQAARIEEIDSEKLDNNLGSENAGKVLTVDSNGNVIAESTTETGALVTVAHDTSLKGSGKDSDPLGVADSVLESKQDVATAVNYDNITNCLTEIPQDIKLELNNGTLTLKAGSKVYVPNGAGVFDLITTTQDCSINSTIGNANDKVFIAYKNNAVTSRPVSSSVSGAGATTTIGFAFDTTTNKINFYNASGVLQSTDWSFPIAIVSTDSSGVASSIDQVFNGFGYIGSCVFTLPGVKGLYPNGRNEDGTLKNGLINCTTVQVSSNFNDTLEHTLMINPNGRCAWYSTTGWRYNDIANVMVASSGTVLTSSTLGTFKTTNGVISNFNPHEVFHAVDYSEYLQTKKSLENKDSELDNKVSQKVNKSGDTMTGNLSMNNGDIVFRDTQTSIGVTTNTWHQSYPAFADKNNVRIGYIQPMFMSDGSVTLVMTAGDPTNGEKALRLNSKGGLVWNNKSVITTDGGTFTGNIAIQKETPQINLKSTVMDITSDNWAEGRNTIAWCMDKNGYESAGVYNTTDSGGTARASLYVMSRKSGSQVQATLGVGVNSSGGTYATAPNTPDGAGSNEIVTASWAKSKFLPLAGGTMTGTIITKSQILFENANSTGHRGFLYKTSDGALSMGLSKSDNSGWQSYQSFFTSGQYQMTVSNGTNIKSLVAKSDGTLTWDGKAIVRLVAEQKATTANSFRWYRKYSDGWLEQGGIITTTETITLPAAFSNDKYTVVCGGEYSFNGDNSVLEITATTIKFQHAINKPHRYYACGYAAS